MTEKLAKADAMTLVFKAEVGGKIRITYSLWDDAKVIGPDEVVELRSVQGKLIVSRRPRERDLALDYPKTAMAAMFYQSEVDPLAVELDPVTGYE